MPAVTLGAPTGHLPLSRDVLGLSGLAGAGAGECY